MDRKLYQELANRINSAQHCEASREVLWAGKHRNVVEQLIDCLPHGSGIDGTTEVDFRKSNHNLIVIHSSFHCMNPDGYYDGWVDFTVTVKPSLISDIDLNIKGAFGKYGEVKEYLYDVFYHALKSMVEVEVTGKGNDAEISVTLLG